MIELKEQVINGVMAVIQSVITAEQMRVVENAIREQLRGIRLEKESTELCTEMDDNIHVLQIFAANKKLEGCQMETIKQYVRSNRNFLEAANKNYKNVTKDDVKMYLAIYSQGRKQNSVVNMKRYLSSFFSWLHEEGYITKNPVKAIKGIKPEPVRPVYLTIEEEIAVREYAVGCSPRDRAIISVLLSTGIRVGEIEALNRNDLNIQEGSITFRGEKSLKYRTVYLDIRAKKHLTEYLLSRTDANPAMFITDRKYKDNGVYEYRRLKKHAYERITKETCAAAGVTDKKCTVHVFRKTFATRLAERDCPLEVIQQLMGHADAGTTSKHYVGVSDQRIKQACGKYLVA